MSDTIGNGLESQIENFIKEHFDTGLIVIDTLQKVRSNTSANVNPYAADYDDINALKLLINIKLRLFWFIILEKQVTMPH